MTMKRSHKHKSSNGKGAPMRKLLSFLIALASIAFGISLSAAQCRGFGQQGGTGENSVIASGGGGGLSLDGTPVTATGSGATTTLPGFSTAAGSGEIVVAIITNAASVTSVTAPGLTFTLRSSYTGGAGASVGAVFTAPYTSNFSGTVTVTVASSSFAQATVFAIGSATTGDTGGPVAKPSGGAASITTTNANDFVFASMALSTSTGTVGAGWTQIANANFMLVEFQIVSSTGTFTGTLGTGTPQGTIIDAWHP
jgi:hypothetical protein